MWLSELKLTASCKLAQHLYTNVHYVVRLQACTTFAVRLEQKHHGSSYVLLRCKLSYFMYLYTIRHGVGSHMGPALPPH